MSKGKKKKSKRRQREDINNYRKKYKKEKGKQKEIDFRNSERDYSRKGWDGIQICNCW
jgi:hypothetical protein